jgi:hypothetical protein
MTDAIPVNTLNLPGRFEKLETESRNTGSDLAGIIERVDNACTEIEIVLREVKTSGIGRLQILHGHSGSGKTTFLHGLHYFFQNIDVIRIPKTVPLQGIADFIEKDSLHRKEHRLYIIHDRDNPSSSNDELRAAFELLRSLFRTDPGRVLVVWPVTDLNKANDLADVAWDIGRDSLLGTRARVYNFDGLPKDSFAHVADTTTRALNSGENLESFGVGGTVAHDLARESETIGEYYSRLNAKSAERNASVLTLLKTRTRPHVWIVVPGDDLKELDRTVSSLTQGTRNRLDIDKIAEFLDNDENKSAYLTDWRVRRADMAYLMRILDVRLFELPPNAALASVRCYGNDPTRAGLQKKNETSENCADTITRTRLGQALLDPDATLALRVRETSDEMAKEFVAIQQLASRGDKALNKAVALAISDFLKRNGKPSNVVSEKQAIPGSQLFPDIQITQPDGSIACLELTWRSTGKSLSSDAGDRKPQNTLTAGHIMKYLLEKVMEYVKDLGL